MPFQPQRFIHAANIRLDVPVSVHISEQLTDELRHALEDATLTSFDYVASACIARSVDFLLLSGNVFLEADRSLRARLTLLKAFRRLEDSGIPVYVIPGDADPPEAWRTIPELPSNVTVCYSSNPDPEVLVQDGQITTSVSASMWYGESDAFGIRVIGRGQDGISPFRIGVVSQAKYAESRRMASLTSSGDDDLLKDVTRNEDDSADSSPSPAQYDAPETTAEYEAAFREYVDRLMTEGHLNYVAYMGELERLTVTLDSGKVHCPGTTQPRNQIEADCGLCSVVTVDSEGEVTTEALNTSAVDWKTIDLYVESTDTLNTCLQKMKRLLMEESRSDSDCVWAVCWTVRGPLPVLREFIEEDLELAVTVELDELKADGQKIRLVHEVRTLPDAWELPDKSTLGQQYADLITEDAIVSRRRLMNLVRTDKTLSEGWRQRFESLVAGVDRERILSRLRMNGVDWFVEDIQDLVPDFDDFDEDILKDEAVEEYGLTDDDEADVVVVGEESEPGESETPSPDEESA